MSPEPAMDQVSIPEELLARVEARGISRRDFIKFCTITTAALALPAAMVGRVAAAVADTRLSVIWVEYQSCSGDSEAFLRANQPTAAELVLDLLSIEYADVLMAAAGHQAEAAKRQAMEAYRGKYLLVVEGSVPTGADGAYCTVGGQSALAECRELVKNAAATICVGTCSSFGGIPAAAPNPTGAISVMEAVPGAAIVNLPGCPVNAENLTCDHRPSADLRQAARSRSPWPAEVRLWQADPRQLRAARPLRRRPVRPDLRRPRPPPGALPLPARLQRSGDVP